MARRALWSGSISFGLVNIPVRMYNATVDRDIRFHLLHDQDKVRLQRKMVSSATGREVHPEHIIRGFEFSKDQYVVVQKDEIESCAPEKTKAIEITDFVELSQIDPLYYQQPYYLAPQAAAAKSYRLLVEAMTRSKKVGLATFVMHEKQHLAALRVLENIICLETMRFADEIVPEEEIEKVVPMSHAKIGERELKAATQLIDSMTTKFDPSKYDDEFRKCIMAMVQKKMRGEEVHVRPAPERQPSRGGDLVSALEASLAATRKRSSGTNGHSNGHHRRRRKSA
ncbi:MAG TPA: Ku protein [Tepidisphaeraceae bacterium]|jgi:DNA end-binding protein Ku